MKFILTFLVAMTLTMFANAATINDMSLVNQFGETSVNQIKSVSAAGAAKVLTASTPAGVTGKLLTGFVSGAGTVSATDSILTGFNKLSGNQPVVVSCSASAGGAASEALTCTGLAAADTILAVTQRVAGANSVAMIGYSLLVLNGLTVTWTANPGAGAIVRVTVKH